MTALSKNRGTANPPFSFGLCGNDDFAARALSDGYKLLLIVEKFRKNGFFKTVAEHLYGIFADAQFAQVLQCFDFVSENRLDFEAEDGFEQRTRDIAGLIEGFQNEVSHAIYRLA